MAREPFSTNADGNGFSGVSGYGTNDARTPALGRSSRDLAADTGPGGAPPGMYDAPDVDTDAPTGTGTGTPTDADHARRDKKTNPEVDPDTRLGLRPTTAGTVAPALPVYPASGPRTRMAAGGLAGLIGAAVAAAVWYALFWAGVAPQPPSLAVVREVVAGGFVPVVLGLVASVAAGGVWGMLFGLLVRKPTVLKGMAFGVLPALLQWLVLPPLTGAPAAAGIVLPLLFSVFVWGTLTGYTAGRWLRPPYSAAVDPDLTSAARI
jgi:hypothetical protein